MVRNILVYRTGQLGDTLASLPAIRAIRDVYRNDNFILLTDRKAGVVSSWDVLQPTKLFSEVLFYAAPGGRVSSWVPFIKLASEIRRRKPAALFYLREFSWTHRTRDRFFFERICGIPACHGFEAPAKRTFGDRDSTGKLEKCPREVDYYLGLVRGWGIPAPPSESVDFALPVSAKERALVDAFWSDERIDATATVIGIGPGSKMPAKRWPLERFEQIGKRILALIPGCRLIVLGGFEDVDPGERLRGVLGSGVVNTAGKLSLFESAEALRRCSLYVGNDTGTMHLAAAVGTPCVAIFSSRDHPGRWDPYGTQHVVLRAEPPCAGCLLDICSDQDMKCLKDISVPDVMEAIEHVLKTTMKVTGVKQVYAGI
ncbi:MAG TPA: glycosyltransferase family 9 protein [Terriglobia bacterium]|nr:glycosyltransferase family 9 protein [Terriglobia bacterium]